MMKFASMFVLAAFASGCDAQVDVTLPFIGIDQDSPAVGSFVSHLAKAKVEVEGEEKAISAFEWEVTDPAGHPVSVNTTTDRAEWIPTRAGRHQVAVTMTYDNGTPDLADDDKSVTETRDVDVADGATRFGAVVEDEALVLSWPVNAAAISRTYEVSYVTTANATPTTVAITDAAAGTTEAPRPDDVTGLVVTFRLQRADGTAFHEATLTALPAVVRFEITADGEPVARTPTDGCLWNFPGVATGGSADQTIAFRNTSTVPILYLFRNGWTFDQRYLPGKPSGPDPRGTPIHGLLAPGESVDISEYHEGVFGLIGSVRPFSTAEGRDQSVVSWPDGQVGAFAASEIFVAELSVHAICAPAQVWKE